MSWPWFRVAWIALATLCLGFVLTLAACAQTGPTQDRNGVNCDNSASANCAPIDETRDVDWVMIERNANDAPNLVISCVAGMGYLSGTTPRGGSDGGGGGGQVTRAPEWDPMCKVHTKQTVVQS